MKEFVGLCNLYWCTRWWASEGVDASASALRFTLAFALALAFAEEHRNHQPMRSPFQLHRAENGNCHTSYLMPS
jgi:hypothetical protein